MGNKGLAEILWCKKSIKTPLYLGKVDQQLQKELERMEEQWPMYATANAFSLGMCQEAPIPQKALSK